MGQAPGWVYMRSCLKMAVITPIDRALAVRLDDSIGVEWLTTEPVTAVLPSDEPPLCSFRH